MDKKEFQERNLKETHSVRVGLEMTKPNYFVLQMGKLRPNR